MKLHPLDLLIIAVYMLGVTFIGWYFSRRQRNLRDYFLSDKNIPWWALAGSIVATETSTVTFISVPAFAFAANAGGVGGNFTFLQLALGYLIGRILIVWLFIPLYFRGELFTVYQILDQRFGGRVKRTAATLFLGMRTVADGIRLFATALVLVTLTGWSEINSILLIGVMIIAFTYLGGIAAVIWTDLIQLFIYLIGALVAAIILLNGIPGGWNAVVEMGRQQHKFQWLDFTFSLSRSYTFWAGLIGGAFLNTATHGTDQFMVQRYLCARTPRAASVALLCSGIIVFVQFVLFLFIGVMLFAFYQSGQTLPENVARRPDQIFPYFIVTQLPHGVIGLVVAAIFAAAMSSSLSALAATTLTDFYRPLVAPRASEEHYLKVSRWLTVGWGAAQIIVGIIAIRMEQRIVDAVLLVASLTNGPILGLFLLSTLTRGVGPVGALAGVCTGIVVMTVVWLGLSISWQWYVLMGSSITFLAGYLVHLLFERKTATPAA